MLVEFTLVPHSHVYQQIYQQETLYDTVLKSKSLAFSVRHLIPYPSTSGLLTFMRKDWREQKVGGHQIKIVIGFLIDIVPTSPQGGCFEARTC